MCINDLDDDRRRVRYFNNDIGLRARNNCLFLMDDGSALDNIPSYYVGTVCEFWIIFVEIEVCSPVSKAFQSHPVFATFVSSAIEVLNDDVLSIAM